MTTDENKRKTARISYACYITIWEPGGYNTFVANAVNIGGGGVLVTMDQGIMIGAKVDLKIEFSEVSSFECIGRVLRCKKYGKSQDSDKDFFTVAIVFENLNQEQEKFIKNMIEEILKLENKLS